MRQRGFTLVETLIVVLIVCFGFLALLTVYMHNVRYSAMSRAQLLAVMLAENKLSEIRDHPYGSPPPHLWGRRGHPEIREVPVVVQGRPVKTTFSYWVDIAPEGNGSFFNASKTQSTDTVEVGVEWREGTADSSAGVEKKLYWKFMVKREPDLVVPVQ